MLWGRVPSAVPGYHKCSLSAAANVVVTMNAGSVPADDTDSWMQMVGSPLSCAQTFKLINHLCLCHSVHKKKTDSQQ